MLLYCATFSSHVTVLPHSDILECWNQKLICQYPEEDELMAVQIAAIDVFEFLGIEPASENAEIEGLIRTVT